MALFFYVLSYSVATVWLGLMLVREWCGMRINRVVMAVLSGWLGFAKTELFKLLLRQWRDDVEAFIKLVATWLNVGVEFGLQMSEWEKRLPHGIRKQWFAQTLPDLHGCTRQQLQKLSCFCRLWSLRSTSLYQAFCLAGCLPLNTGQATVIREARTRHVVWARWVKLKNLTENFDAYTTERKREFNEASKPNADLYGRLC